MAAKFVRVRCVVCGIQARRYPYTLKGRESAALAADRHEASNGHKDRCAVFLIETEH